MNLLLELTSEFSVEIINICDEAKENKKAKAILNQLLRSGTSIGANVHEGNYASSKADFINKFQIALKECYETEYWLKLFAQTNIISEDKFKPIFAKCCKIRTILAASVKTAKENLKN
jgi:four helix bundle protein